MQRAINGVDLHYEVRGEGAPLLWLHGFLGAGADWNYMFNDVPAGFQLIAPDLRGHGGSTNPSGEFSFREAARDVLGLLDALRIDRIRAIGVSGGGLTLLHLATMRPALVDAMVVVSAPPYFPAQARVIQRNVSEAMFSASELEMMQKRHAHGPDQWQQLLVHARGFADSYDDVNFTPPYLATIAADTLIVFGDRDPLYPVSLAFELYSAIPKSYLCIVPNGGHAPVFGSFAPRFLDLSLPFLRGEWAPVNRPADDHLP